MADNLTEFIPSNCPVGITNEKSIENLGDRVDRMIERLTEKVSEMKEDITSLHKGMDEKFDNVDKRFDSMEDNFNKKLDDLKGSIPDTVNDQLDRKKGTTAFAALKWVFCGVGSTVLIAIITAWVKAKLGL